ncbi:hypothetical protein [Weissella cibaria]|uniref:hypothetical protein n=1 Tax=Weissella cibaria TaxID=137591 RepID=UPI001899A133|nr:hypothetical protein [Weissella cibaria]
MIFKRKKKLGFWEESEKLHQKFQDSLYTKNPQPGTPMNEYELWLRARRGEDVSIYKLAEPRRSGWLNRLFFGGI